jgi:HEAT repeat protein
MGRFAILGFLLLSANAAAQVGDRESVARRLSAHENRRAMVAALDQSFIPTLLEWTKKPPKGVVVWELSAGLAEAFAKFPTAAAIPFLIDNIYVDNLMGASLNPWQKSDAHIINDFPAVKALLNYGSGARKPLMAKLDGGRYDKVERLAAVFVIARLGRSKESLDFLRSLKTQSEHEEFRRLEGIAIQTGDWFEWKGKRFKPD